MFIKGRESLKEVLVLKYNKAIRIDPNKKKGLKAKSCVRLFQKKASILREKGLFLN
jgi:hypothetical protein